MLSHPSNCIRINAFLASAGLGSRRSVEKIIQEGRIILNGKVVRDLVCYVDPKKDQILYHNKPLHPLNLRYMMLNKPQGYTCTRDSRHATHIIYDLLPADLHHLTYAGRLDADSEGLILLSNDGWWLNKMAHPRYQTLKIYEIEVAGHPHQETLKMARTGILSKGECLKVLSVELLSKKQKSSFLRLTLNEGKNREIRRIFGALHHPVIQLRRTAIGNLKLGDLKTAQWRELTEKEILCSKTSL